VLQCKLCVTVLLPRDAVYCKVRYWDCMSSFRPSVCPSVSNVGGSGPQVRNLGN